MALAIKVENLSKAYQLGEIGTGTLAWDLERWFAKIRGKEDPFLKIGEANDRTTKGNSQVVWSLKDINFEIEEGDAVGIIGRNGAGKSTLLKILSRVTSPTTGIIKGKGRIASLLEVGTGFHPELTGRENIYINGAILGMRKKEITRKFDEIVDFAGVERYIDTPVKRYSSGMYVRLAFAVAAYLDSEILIVDEVLAVGDAEFQNKCLGKMSDISKGEGRTVLFISHNMGAISQLCNKGILLEKGKLNYTGDKDKVIGMYLSNNKVTSNYIVPDDSKLLTQIIQADILNKQGSQNVSFAHNEEVHVIFKIKNNSNEKGMRGAVAIWDTLENLITIDRFDIESKGYLNYITEIPKNLLVPNHFKISISIYIPQVKVIEIIKFLSFEVVDVGITSNKTGEHLDGIVFSKMKTFLI